MISERLIEYGSPLPIAETVELIGLPTEVGLVQKQMFPTHEIVNPQRQLREDLRYIQGIYGIKVSMHRIPEEGEGYAQSARKLKLQEAIPAVHALREEISKYSPEFINFCKIKQIRLFESPILLKRESDSDEEENIGGFVDYNNRSIYFSMGFDGIPSLVENFHHEVFHMSDERYILGQPSDKLDKAWRDLNETDDKVYLRDDYDRVVEDEGDFSYEGFAWVYGRKNEWEDRATMAELLMVKPGEAIDRAKQDHVLDNKLQKIMVLFHERSNGLMDNKYFSDLSLGNVKEGYWDIGDKTYV